MGGEELKWHQLAHMSQQGPHYSPKSKAKANYKSINLRKIGNKCFKCCNIRFSSFRENPSEEVDEYDNYYYYEYIARKESFSRAPEIDFRYELKARKVMVDFKFDAQYS